MDSFAAFQFIEPIARALQEQGYTRPTPVQAQAIPLILDGRDVIGVAQTGTGKTAAFVLPLLQRLQGRSERKASPRVLVLVPTRELAGQIAEAFNTYGKHLKLAHVVLYGGVPQEPQVHALSRHVDVVIATPGRLLDLARQKKIHFDGVQTLVLDEADRMLDMGFTADIKSVVQELPAGQRLLFSATMPPEVERLAHKYLQQPAQVRITAQATTAGKIKQVVLYVDREDKFLLLKSLLEVKNAKRVIVFTQMKHMVDKIATRLASSGVKAEALHSDRTQAQRTQALENFRAGKTQVLVATDIAARGIDVDDVTHVINYDLPKQNEVYVHRIGRTGRAGMEGNALTFCCSAEREQLKAIELMIGKKLTIREHKYHSSYAQTGKHSEQKPRVVAQKKKKTHKGRNTDKWKQR